MFYTNRQFSFLNEVDKTVKYQKFGKGGWNISDPPKERWYSYCLVPTFIFR